MYVTQYTLCYIHKQGGWQLKLVYTGFMEKYIAKQGGSYAEIVIETRRIY